MTNTFARITGLATAALFATTSYGAGKTDMAELVMYGIDADSYELLRYTFHNDEYTRIGVVTDEVGDVVEDCESLAYIPAGPYAGFYGGTNFYNESPSRLVKINAMDATGEYLPQTVGFAKLEGLVAVEDTVTGDWFLLGTTQGETYDGDDPDGDPCLIRINPATGRGTLIRTTAENFDGLAMGLDGTLWGVEKDGQVYTIDVATGNDNSTSADSGYGALESLEWAFGDAGMLGIDTGVVPAAWTTNGVLFSFSDDADALLIVNPATGEAVEYHCSFDTIDCEGIVFTTLSRDSFGAIVSDPHD